jgi:predicted kinase
MSNLLILTIGVPSCGKTTWVKNYLKEHSATVVISTDKLRIELTGTAECDSRQNPMIYSEARRRARKALEEKHDVIIDATNVDVHEWLAYKEICRDDTIRVAKVFKVTPEEAMKRMQQRERKVPKEIVEKKWQQLQSNMQFLPYIFNFII